MYKLVSEEIEIDIGERDVILVLTNGEEHTVTIEGDYRVYYQPVDIPDRPFPQIVLEEMYEHPNSMKVKVIHVSERSPLSLLDTGDRHFMHLNKEKTAFINRNMIAKVKVGQVFEKKIKVTQCKVVKVEQV